MPASTRSATPFFESPPRVGGRRFLLVSYHFPPDSNVGALRWEMLLRHAAKRGWSADVLMMETPDSQPFETSRLSLLPPGTRLFGVALPTQTLITLLRLSYGLVPRARRNSAMAELAKKPAPASEGWRPTDIASLDRIKRNLLAWAYYRQWRGWAARAARFGVALSRATEYECVISSGPPHMAHEAARRIAQSASLTLITDFRDPWTSNDGPPPSADGKVWRMLSNRYERRSLEASTLIVANTASAARFTKSKYPELSDRVITIMNGADAHPGVPVNPESRFAIAYTGSLYGGRYPQSLFRAVHRVIDRHRLTTADLVVHFVGVDEPQRVPLTEMASAEGIAPFFVCETWRPRNEALALLDRASILVILPQVHIHSVPAKLFEYVQRPVRVLVLSEPETAVAELLRNTDADVVMPDDVDAIAGVIERRFEEWRKGVKPVPLNADGRFSRERQADRLFDEIDRLLQPGGVPHRAGPGTSATFRGDPA